MLKSKTIKKLTGGLLGCLSLILAVSLCGTKSCYDWEMMVDLKLGITGGSGVVSGDITSENVYYKSSFGDITPLYKSSRTSEEEKSLSKIQASLEEAEKAFCIREEEEGAVLLKNEDDALPLKSGAKISLFGYAIGHPVYRSSSGGASSNVEGYTISLADGLRNNGFTLNESLVTALEGTDSKLRVSSSSNGESNIGELPTSFYDAYKSSFSTYNDAAVVMLARTGGEGIDLNTKDQDGISQLALHDNEKALLKMIKDSGKFSKTIVLIDSGYPMELGFINEEAYGVSACLWIGNPGMYGFQGVSNLLSGKANPSGHLVDTYATSSFSAPATNNFGDFSFTNNKSQKYIVEAEGIYAGYRYYETRYEDCVLGQGNAADSVGSIDGKAWDYSKEVVYPFGYGLSYTEFSQTIQEVDYDESLDVYSVKVKVKNTGPKKGKCSVMVYSKTPYDSSLCENGAIRLVGFNKTLGKTSNGAAETNDLASREGGMLDPGDEEVVTVDVDGYLMASYSSLVNEGKGGYVLPKGDYYLSVGYDAHEALNNVLYTQGKNNLFNESALAYTGDSTRVKKIYTLTQQDSLKYQNSPYTGEKVENQLEKMDVNYWQKDSVNYLSRSDWKSTYPKTVNLSLNDSMSKEMDGANYVADSSAEKKGSYKTGENNNISFIEMKDVPFTGTYTDKDGKTVDAEEKWNLFLNQLTTDELISATTNGKGANSTVNSPDAKHGDGPDGLQGTKANGNPNPCYDSEIVAASSFNPKTIKMRGDFLAEDALFTKSTVQWGPGANIHRTPFSGRNFEYYSEDGNMSYLCANYQVSASREKGLITCIKHFSGNNQETNRTGVATFNNEQAWRENSMRAFEGGIAKGKSLGVMTSFSLIGCTPAPACKSTNINILQKEWGFNGVNITDSSYQMKYMDSVDCIMNGTTTFCLDNREADLAKQNSRSKYDDILGGLRKANKQFYYTLLHSNASNGISKSSTISGTTSWWKTAFTIINSSLGILVTADAALYVIFMIKSKKEGEIHE